MLCEITIGLLTVLTLVYLYFKYMIYNYWRKRDVFYLEPTVPIGNAYDLIMGKSYHGEFFEDLYKKYKDRRIVGLYTFHKPNLLITDLDLIKTVLTKEFWSFQDRGLYCNEKVDPLSGNLFHLPGQKWRNLRVKMTPTFTSGKIKQMFVVLKECGEELGKSLETAARTRDAVDIKDVFGRYTTDIIMSVAFGMKSNCVTEGDNEFRKWGKKAFEDTGFWIGLIAFWPEVMEFFSIPSTDRGVTKFFTTIFRDNVEYRKKHNIVRHDFMNLLMQLMQKSSVELDGEKDTTAALADTNNLTMLEATAQAFVFFLAGFETSSTTATFCLYELAQNKDIQDKVHQEIDENLKKHGGLTYDAMNEMTYLHKIVQETLRKYPPVGSLNRICTKDITLPTTDVHLTRGTLIVIPVHALHRDPSLYPDPDKFDPERFSPEQIAERNPYAYIPFGEGPRICIGARFGYVQTKVGIISILSKFNCKLHPQTSVPLTFNEADFILTAKTGVHLIFEPR